MYVSHHPSLIFPFSRYKICDAWKRGLTPDPNAITTFTCPKTDHLCQAASQFSQPESLSSHPNPSLTISLAASPITVPSSKRGFCLLLPLFPNNHPDSKCQQRNPRVVNHLVVSFGDVSQRCALHEGLSSTAAASQVESWSAGARPTTSSSSSSTSSSSSSSSSLHSTEGSVFSSHHIIIRTLTG